MMDILPINRGFPILGIDVWEHAYYLAYQNKRADYLDSFWSVLDWSSVEKKYEEALLKIR
jgi:Fe-Mn family superoxide dismutase